MTTETEIGNRAIQRCGGERIAPGSTLWNEDSKNASELRACYDLIRRSELRRNVWSYSVRTERASGTSHETVTVGRVGLTLNVIGYGTRKWTTQRGTRLSPSLRAGGRVPLLLVGRGDSG